MSRRNAEILLAAVIIARSTSYLFAKLSLNSIEPFNLLGIRFLISFVILNIIFFKKLKNINLYEILYGTILGISLFAVMSLELYGLKTIDSSMASFIENTAIVFVPIFEAILIRKLPKFTAIISTFITLFGVGLLTVQNTSFHLCIGQIFCFGAAILYAILIILTDRYSHKGDAIILGIIQIGIVGILGLISSLIFEQTHLPTTSQEWTFIIFLILICTVFGFTFQPLAQKYTSAERAGQFCALNPVSAAILGWIFLNETMDLLKIIGAILILGSVFYTSTSKKQDELKYLKNQKEAD